MSYLQWIYAYLLTVPIFFALDMVWLGVISRGLYRREMGELMRADVNWFAGIGFYLVYIIGILIFSVHPALKSDSWQTALFYGALFGFFCYATYDLTGLAVIKDWSMRLTAIDIVWGTVLTGAVSTLSYLAITKFIS